MKYWRRVIVPALVVVAACVVAAALLRGHSGALSALGGGAGVVVLLASTPGILGPVALALPGLSLAAALMFYLTKIAVLAAAFAAMSTPGVRDGLDAPALAGTVIVTTLAWTVLIVAAQVRSRQPVYDLPEAS